LLQDGSVLSEKSLWTLEHLQSPHLLCHRASRIAHYSGESLFRGYAANPNNRSIQDFVNQLDDGEGNFFEKLSSLFAQTAPEVKQLAAELLWVMFLCPGNTDAAKKREGIKTIWEWFGGTVS